MSKSRFIVVSLLAATGSIGMVAPSQVSARPRITVSIVVNSGKPNQTFDITGSNIGLVRNEFLPGRNSGLRVPEPDWPTLGWRGFRLVGHGGVAFPREVRVLRGVIRIVYAGGGAPRFYDDVHGLEEWLTQRAEIAALIPAVEEDSASGDVGSVFAQAANLPLAGSEPAYEPERWNIRKAGERVQTSNNCYNYGCNEVPGKVGKFAQPGRAHNKRVVKVGCERYVKGATADGLTVQDCGKVCPVKTSFKVALVIDATGAPGVPPDFHWYRQDDNGKWSHKPGETEAINVDSANKPITDPRKAKKDRPDRLGRVMTAYQNCRCFCVDPANVAIR